MSCCARSVVGVNTVTIEMDLSQRKLIVDAYAKAAALRIAIRQASTSKIATPDAPLPVELRLTTAGCNNNHQTKISAMINTVYAVIRDVAASQQVTLDGRFTQTNIYRMDVSNLGTEFGFLFSSTKDSLSVIIIPKIYPKSGLLIEKYCIEKNQIGKYHDGLGGTYTQEIKIDSPECGWVPAEKGGKLLIKTCRGFDQWGEYHDGNYGTYFQQIKENSTDCGYVAPPKAGTAISKTCEGKDQWGVYADGTGGTRRELIKENSPACGYVAPTPAGQAVRSECQGTSYVKIEADGQGGTRTVVLEANSSRCGGSGGGGGTPGTPTPPPGGNTPPGLEPSGDALVVCYNGAVMRAQLRANGEYTFTYVHNNHPLCLKWQKDPAMGNGIWMYPDGGFFPPA